MDIGNMFDGVGGGPIEPNAEIRDAAKGLYALRTSLVEAGFTDEEAMRLVSEALRSQ